MRNERTKCGPELNRVKEDNPHFDMSAYEGVSMNTYILEGYECCDVECMANCPHGSRRMAIASYQWFEGLERWILIAN